jgi:hypothetical protein
MAVIVDLLFDSEVEELRRRGYNLTRAGVDVMQEVCLPMNSDVQSPRVTCRNPATKQEEGIEPYCLFVDCGALDLLAERPNQPQRWNLTGKELRGRGKLTGTACLRPDGTLAVRLDDEQRLEFWAEVCLNLRERAKGEQQTAEKIEGQGG